MMTAAPERPILAENRRPGSYPNFAQHVSREVTPGDEVVKKWPNSCPSVFERLPRGPRIGPNSSKIGRFVNSGHTLADLGQICPEFCQSLPMGATLWPIWAKSGQVWQNSTRLWPTHRPNRPKSIDVLPSFHLHRAKLVDELPTLARRSNCGQKWVTLVEVWPRLGSRGNALARQRCRRHFLDNVSELARRR